MIRVQEQKLPAGLQRMDEQEIAFKTPSAVCIMFSVFALMGFSEALFMLWVVANRPNQSVEICFMYTGAAGFGVSSLYLLYLLDTRLFKLTFDLRRRTYRLTTGFPFTSRTQQGTYEEFAGLFIRSDRASSGKPLNPWVHIAWDHPGRRDIALFLAPDGDVADRVMRQVADALGLSAGEEVLERLWFRNPRLRRYDEQELVFHKPTSVRLAWGISGKVIAVASLVLSGALVVTSGGLHFHAGSNSLGVILLDVVGLLCLRTAGPEDLEVDLGNRTYCYRYGFAYISQERLGSLEDIIALKTDAQGSNSTIRVRLVWKQPRRGDMTLGEFRSQPEADAHLRGVAARLGLNLD